MQKKNCKKRYYLRPCHGGIPLPLNFSVDEFRRMTLQTFDDEARLCQLITCFDELLGQKFDTQLISGGLEPIYLPKSAKRAKAHIVFSYDYFSSALHELAHWCVAGEQRREQEDYGYWYAPDGRSAQQQQLFERVEIKPQAIEWLLSKACGVKFRVSVDNLSANAQPSDNFKANILAQVQQYCRGDLSKRPWILVNGLAERFQQTGVLNPASYCLEDLDSW